MSALFFVVPKGFSKASSTHISSRHLRRGAAVACNNILAFLVVNKLANSLAIIDGGLA